MNPSEPITDTTKANFQLTKFEGSHKLCSSSVSAMAEGIMKEVMDECFVYREGCDRQPKLYRYMCNVSSTMRKRGKLPAHSVSLDPASFFTS